MAPLGTLSKTNEKSSTRKQWQMYESQPIISKSTRLNDIYIYIHIYMVFSNNYSTTPDDVVFVF